MKIYTTLKNEQSIINFYYTGLYFNQEQDYFVLKLNGLRHGYVWFIASAGQVGTKVILPTEPVLFLFDRTQPNTSEREELLH